MFPGAVHAGLHAPTPERHSRDPPHHGTDPLYTEGRHLSRIVRFPRQQRARTGDEQIPHDALQLPLFENEKSRGRRARMMGWRQRACWDIVILSMLG